MEEVTKLGIVEEDEQKYITKEVDRMAQMVLNKEESDRETRDAKDDDSDTISNTQESGWPEEEISLEPPSGQVGVMRVMVSLEGGSHGDGLLRRGGDEPGGDHVGGEGVPEIIVSGRDRERTYRKV